MNRVQIRSALLMAGVSQAEIARALGVSAVSVSCCISGKSRSRRIERALSDATDIPLQILFPDAETPLQEPEMETPVQIQEPPTTPSDAEARITELVRRHAKRKSPPTNDATPAPSPAPANAAQLRLLEVIRALSGHEVFGRRLVDLAADLKQPEPVVLRDLEALAVAGWATRDDGKRWRLGPAVVQIAVQFYLGLQNARNAIDETQQRYTRTPQ